MTASQHSSQEPLSNAPELMKVINFGAMSQAVCVAAELGIADLLVDGPRQIETLAQATSSHAASLRRLLRALATIGFCREEDDGSFALGPLGSVLRTDSSNSLRSWTVLWGRYQWPLWTNLLHSVKTGESARKLASGADGFAYLEDDPDFAAVFNRAMAELTHLVAREVVRTYDFPGGRRIVDVGGGYGSLLAGILDSDPSLRGLLFDLPHAIEGARANLTKLGLIGRSELVAGDFFKSIPHGGDIYLLKAVIHDWDDKPSKLILQNCRSAMTQGTTLLLIERIVPRRFEPCPQHNAIAKVDLSMLVEQGGRERSEAEFRDLLEDSGFAVVRVLATELDYSIIECVPR
jgi:hypothetical protein